MLRKARHCRCPRKLEQMLVLDYLIVNEDRHLNNFGLIRSAVTLEWVGVAPLYDNGNSMWFNRVVSEMHADDDSNIKTPLWKKNPTENLELVTDFSWLDLSALDGIEDFVRELYESPSIWNRYVLIYWQMHSGRALNCWTILYRHNPVGRPCSD